MTEYLQNCRVYSTNISNYYSNEIEIKSHRNQKTSVFMSYVEKTSYLRLHRLVIALLTKTLIIYSKLIRIYPYLLYSLEIGCSRHVQNFNDVL